MVTRREALSVDYSKMYDYYWSATDHIGEASNDLKKIASKVISVFGYGKVLDIGCGEGGLVAELLKQGSDAYGLDVSEIVVNRCNQRFPGRFTLGSVLALPFPDAHFKTVVSTDCLEHLTPDDVPIALKEIFRVTEKFVFLQIATTNDRDGHWHLTVEGRAWWESQCFQAGFRKSAYYYVINDYESLNSDGWQIFILLEKHFAPEVNKDLLIKLANEHDLHCDMLQVTGSRSDAHVQRYFLAAKYVRAGDRVLDAACGLGYGSYVLSKLTQADRITGIDGSEEAIEYASAYYSKSDSISFQAGFLPKCLSTFPDASFDVVVSFETLEHVEEPQQLLSEFYRVLTPGGRVIVSVPNDWSDESGEDPNPYHYHVYDLQKLTDHLSENFSVEDLYAQTADRVKLHSEKCSWETRPRSFFKFTGLDGKRGPESEWIISIASKSPVFSGTKTAYVERMFGVDECLSAGSALAFGRDYENPWLIKSLIAIGFRTESTDLRLEWAKEVLDTSPIDSADYGAALCVLCYLRMSEVADSLNEMIQRIDRYLEVKPKNPAVLRWQISLLYVVAQIHKCSGNNALAEAYLVKLVKMPVEQYSITLLTKIAQGIFQLGLSLAVSCDFQEAKSVMTNGIARINEMISTLYPLQQNSVPAFLYRELATVFIYASRIRTALSSLSQFHESPYVFNKSVFSDYLSEIGRLEEFSHSLEAQKAELLQIFSDSTSYASKLENGYSEQKKQIDELRVYTSDLEARVSALSAENLSLVEAISGQKSQLDELRQYSADLERSGVVSASINKELMRRIEGPYKVENTQGVEQIEILDYSRRLEAAVSEQRLQIMELSTYSKDLEISRSWLLDRVNSLNMEISEKNVQINELLQNSSELSDAWSKHASQIEELRRYAASLEAEAENFRSLLSSKKYLLGRLIGIYK